MNVKHTQPWNGGLYINDGAIEFNWNITSQPLIIFN